MNTHKPHRFHKVARSTTGLSRNASATLRGYNYRWQTYSKNFRLNNPLCEAMHCFPCGEIFKKGATTCPKCKQPTRQCARPTECVDHITPVKGPDDPLFFEPSNHEGCCWSCHSRVTVKEDGALGRRKVHR